MHTHIHICTHIHVQTYMSTCLAWSKKNLGNKQYGALLGHQAIARCTFVWLTRVGARCMYVAYQQHVCVLSGVKVAQLCSVAIVHMTV